ncbi:hypothetical protein Pmani_003883 [Petrolisthes manimaculis]|uniref:Uncharacterized protein n=1 Tax=Petrolisthes manimaculis TaxID=1843537 RepID=A0AAE1UNV6_9EUCA|nr:hypothetical protein Pmani_003883 [Petrolisthes manimaculis]
MAQFNGFLAVLGETVCRRPVVYCTGDVTVGESAGSGTLYHPLAYGTIRSVHRTFKTIQAQLCHGDLLGCSAVLGACQLEE